MKEKDEIVFQEERRHLIIDILSNENRVTTNFLMKKFKTTAVTIRKDFDALEKQGLLKRTHGGAIIDTQLYKGLALNEKEKLHLEEKERIVKEAVKLISEGDTIIIDSGSTTGLLSKEIKSIKRLTVITNALNVAQELSGTDVDVIVTGGNLQKETSTLIGPLADTVLNKISSGKYFMGVDGIDLDLGLTTPNLQEASTSRVMMKASVEVILLVDSTKFGRRSLGIISKVKDIDRIITTKKMSELELERFAEMKVEVSIV